MGLNAARRAGAVGLLSYRRATMMRCGGLTARAGIDFGGLDYWREAQGFDRARGD